MTAYSPQLVWPRLFIIFFNRSILDKRPSNRRVDSTGTKQILHRARSINKLQDISGRGCVEIVSKWLKENKKRREGDGRIRVISSGGWVCCIPEPWDGGAAEQECALEKRRDLSRGGKRKKGKKEQEKRRGGGAAAAAARGKLDRSATKAFKWWSQTHLSNEGWKTLKRRKGGKKATLSTHLDSETLSQTVFVVISSTSVRLASPSLVC